MKRSILSSGVSQLFLPQNFIKSPKLQSRFGLLAKKAIVIRGAHGYAATLYTLPFLPAMVLFLVCLRRHFGQIFCCAIGLRSESPATAAASFLLVLTLYKGILFFWIYGGQARPRRQNMAPPLNKVKIGTRAEDLVTAACHIEEGEACGTILWMKKARYFSETRHINRSSLSYLSRYDEVALEWPSSWDQASLL